MDEPIPVFAAVVVGVCLVLGGLVVGLVVRRAASGRLGPNHWAGIRIPSMMRSAAAWQAGHRAARPLTDIGAVGMAAAGVAVLPIRTGGLFGVVVCAGVGWALVWLLVGSRRASRAARVVDDATVRR